MTDPTAETMDGVSLPVAPDDERLWLLGPFGFVAVAVLAGAVWTSVPTGTATVRVAEVGDHPLVDVSPI